MLVLGLQSCARVGGPVPGAPPHHRERGFANTDPAFAPASAWVRWSFFVSRVWAATFHPRTASLPVVPSDLSAIRSNPGADTLTWVGHSTLLVQLDGVNVLTDPHWSDRASPVGFAGPSRVTPPGLKFADVPRIHVARISHAAPTATTPLAIRRTPPSSSKSAHDWARPTSPRFRSAPTSRP